MKVKSNYILRSVADQHVVVPTGQEAVNFNGIITLNNSGKILFELLQKETTKEKLVEALLERYDVTALQANADVEEFINTLNSKNILEPKNEA